MVCLSVCHNREPCKSSWTDRDAIWDVDLGGPKGTMYLMGSRSPHVNGQFWGQKEAIAWHPQTCLTADMLKVTQQQPALVHCACRLGCTRWRCTSAPPGEFDWTVLLQRWCGLMSNYFDHLLLSLLCLQDWPTGNAHRQFDFGVTNKTTGGCHLHQHHNIWYQIARWWHHNRMTVLNRNTGSRLAIPKTLLHV